MKNLTNFIILTLSILFLASCSSTKNPKEIPTEIVKIVESSGKIELEIKGDQWQKIKAKGSAAVPVKDKAGIEQAMNIATLRAKASLIEFLDNQVKSDKATNTKTVAYTKEGDKEEVSNEVETTVSEDIASSAKSIVKGAYIIDRTVSSDQTYVSVVLLVDRKVVEISKEIQKSFK